VAARNLARAASQQDYFTGVHEIAERLAILGSTSYPDIPVA
jgi:hypothetical protein